MGRRRINVRESSGKARRAKGIRGGGGEITFLDETPSPPSQSSCSRNLAKVGGLVIMRACCEEWTVERKSRRACCRVDA